MNLTHEDNMPERRPLPRFHDDPFTGGCIAEVSEHFQLGWYPHGDGGGPVGVGNYFTPGGYVTTVSNPLYEWAKDRKDFRRLVHKFMADDGGQQ